MLQTITRHMPTPRVRALAPVPSYLHGIQKEDFLQLFPLL